VNARAGTARFSAADLARAPNLLSLARLPLAAGFPFALASPRAALAVVGVAALTDALDGFVARRSRHVTATGAIIDPICDKVFAIVVIVALVARGMLAPWALPALLAREVLEAPLLLFVLAKRAPAEPAATMAGALGKVTTAALFLAVACSIAWPDAATAAVIVACVFGALAGIWYWHRALARA